MIEQVILIPISSTFNRSVDGNIFEIKTKDYPVTIERIDVHMAAISTPIAVWYRPDTQSPVYVETYQNAIDTDIIGNGQGVLTPLPAFQSPIVLEAQSTYTFYITASKNGVDALYYGMGSELGMAFVSDDFLDVTEGYAMRYSFSSPAFPRQWNGECRIWHVDGIDLLFESLNNFCLSSHQLSLFLGAIHYTTTAPPPASGTPTKNVSVHTCEGSDILLIF